MEGERCDQRQTNVRNGCKISGLRSASIQRPSRGRYICKHRMGGSTDMGSRNQRLPPQDCIKIHIQSQPRRGFHPRRPANTRHRRRGARSKEIKGARRIGAHGQSGDDQAPTVGAAVARVTTIPVRQRQGERKRHQDHGQQVPSTEKGTK